MTHVASQEFEEVKRREVASDAPREVDTTIPGWVSEASVPTRLIFSSFPNYRAHGAEPASARHRQNLNE